MQTRERVMKKIILMCLFGLVFSQTEMTTKLFELDLNLISDDRVFIPISDIVGDKACIMQPTFISFTLNSIIASD